MKKFLTLAAKAAAVTLGALMVFAILFAYGATIVFKHKDPHFKQEFIVEVTQKRKTVEYYCTIYAHDPLHNCIILIDYKGDKVLHLYKNQNTIIEVKKNLDYEPEILIKELENTQQKPSEKKIPKKSV